MKCAANAADAVSRIAAMERTSIYHGGAMVPIIGLAGPEGSGKTTVANMLVGRRYSTGRYGPSTLFVARCAASTVEHGPWTLGHSAIVMDGNS